MLQGINKLTYVKHLEQYIAYIKCHVPKPLKFYFNKYM